MSIMCARTSPSILTRLCAPCGGAADPKGFAPCRRPRFTTEWRFNQDLSNVGVQRLAKNAIPDLPNMGQIPPDIFENLKILRFYDPPTTSEKIPKTLPNPSQPIPNIIKKWPDMTKK